MSGMELYVRFLFTLAAGLAGLGMVLTPAFETVLTDWDAFRDISRWLRGVAHGRHHAAGVRAEDILLELERSRTERYQRPGAIERRREALREVREAEQRLAAPEPA